MKYNIRMAAEKKYKIKVRLKVRNRLLKKAGLTVSAFAAVLVLGYSCFLAVGLAARMPAGRFFAFTAKSLSVNSPSEEISAEISRRMAGKLGGAFTSGEAEVFAAGLKKSYSALSRVEVKRNFVSGRVSVRAESENVIAKVRFNGEKVLYLSESGRLLAEHYGPDPADIFETEVCLSAESYGPVPGKGGRPALGPLAVFLKELRALAPGFSSRPVKLECRGPAGPATPLLSFAAERFASCRLILENSAEVLWGEFEFTKSKVNRLNEVLPDAACKIKGPLTVDFRYFRDGKIFVSKLTGI